MAEFTGFCFRNVFDRKPSWSEKRYCNQLQKPEFASRATRETLVYQVAH